jgi:hypothetical protein
LISGFLALSLNRASWGLQWARYIHVAETWHLHKSCRLFFIVGHTHLDLDQLWSVILSHMLELGSFQTPEKLMAHVNTRLLPLIHQRGEELVCSSLDNVHDFTTWLKGLGREVSRLTMGIVVYLFSSVPLMRIKYAGYH